MHVARRRLLGCGRAEKDVVGIRRICGDNALALQPAGDGRRSGIAAEDRRIRGLVLLDICVGEDAQPGTVLLDNHHLPPRRDRIQLLRAGVRLHEDGRIAQHSGDGAGGRFVSLRKGAGGEGNAAAELERRDCTEL